MRCVLSATMSSIWASEGRIRGDQALLAEAVVEGRIILTKDQDIGVLVYRDRQPHCGVLLLDDLGDAAAEAGLILATLSSHGDRLATRAFLRAGEAGIREARDVSA